MPCQQPPISHTSTTAKCQRDVQAYLPPSCAITLSDVGLFSKENYIHGSSSVWPEGRDLMLTTSQTCLSSQCLVCHRCFSPCQPATVLSMFFVTTCIHRGEVREVISGHHSYDGSKEGLKCCHWS